MRNLIKTPDMVTEAKKAAFKPNGFVQVLIFILIFFITQMIIGIPTGIVIGVKIVLELMNSGSLENGYVNMNIDSNMINKYMPDITLLSLYLSAITIAAVIVYVKFIEKRSLYSMGFSRKKAVTNYALGFLVGLLMFSAVIIVLYLTNNISYGGISSFSVFLLIIPFFIGFLIQGMSEEVMLRGYLMNSLAARHNLTIAIIVNSVIFSLLHLFNPGVNLLAIINIILFGIFASIFALSFNNIWGVGALHSAWNFSQGNIFGLEVSGLKLNNSVLNFKAKGSELINGGSFGPEGGIAVTAVLIISIAVILFINIKRNKTELKEEKAI